MGVPRYVRQDREGGGSQRHHHLDAFRGALAIHGRSGMHISSHLDARVLFRDAFHPIRIDSGVYAVSI